MNKRLSTPVQAVNTDHFAPDAKANGATAPAEDEPDSPLGSPFGASPGNAPENPFAGLLRHVKELMQPKRPPGLRERLERSLRRDAQGLSFSPEERLMLANVLHLHCMRIDDVMVPRAEVVGVEVSTPLRDVVRIFREAEHSRIPVFRETLDDPLGLIHLKDLWAWLYDRTARPAENGDREDAPANSSPKEDAPQTWAGMDTRALNTLLSDIDIIRPVLFVPPSMHVADLLTKMQASRIHMALVIDEYGGTDGLLTIEDLVETVVGDIEDEHDNEAPLISKCDDGTFIADARLSLEEFEAATSASIEASDAIAEIDSLGGLVFTLLGRVPVRGELVTTDLGFEFEVLDADPRRVKSIRIHKRRPSRAPAQPLAHRA